MTKASNNPFPSVLLTEGGPPSAPATGYQRLWSNSSNLNMITAAGVQRVIGGAASGSVATDAIWDAAGDLVQGTGANTAAKLTLGAAGTVVRSTGSTNAYAFPPGYEFDYVELTGDISVTSATEATGDTVVTGSAVSYDGSTVVLIEFYATDANADYGAAGRYLVMSLWDGATEIGNLCVMQGPTNTSLLTPVYGARRLTPSAGSHTYTVKAHVSAGTGHVRGGAGGVATRVPGFIRVTKV